MNAQKSFLFILGVAACAVVGTTTTAHAQTSQYQRNKKATTATADASATPAADGSGTPAVAGTANAAASNGATPAAPGAAAKPNDKVDVSDLENRYWESKDTEFHVVQNRQYTKAKRFSFALQYGPIINSTYATGNQIGFTGNYYFSERLGLQAMYDAPQVSPNTLVSSFQNQNGAVPNYNMIKGYYGAGVSWIPFYAKMSVLEQKILYFDMAITPNIGITNYQQQIINGGGANMSAFTYGIDVSQHFYLSKTFAIRWDLLNRFYSENVVKYYQTGNDPGAQSATTTTFLIGVQAFF